MALDRTNITPVDDDGTGTTGTIINAAWWSSVYDEIDAEIAAADASVRTVAKGGTGASTLTDGGVLVGNGAGVIQATAVGTAGHVLTSNGAGSDPTFQALPAAEWTEQTATETGNQDNYSLSAAFTLLRCTGAAPVFRGFTIGGNAPSAGDRVRILCLGTTAKVAHQDANSTAANRIICPSTAGQIVGVNGVIDLFYDDTTDRWRSVLVDPGAPIARTFAAGDFTGNGSMTVTVAEADVATHTYQQRGKQLIVAIRVKTFTVGGTPSTEIRVALPSSFTVTREVATIGLIADNGTFRATWVDVVAAGTYVRFFKEPQGGNWSASTDASQLAVVFEMEVD